MTNQNEFAIIAQESNLPQDKIQSLQSSFQGMFKETREIVEGAKEIVVTEESQVALMKEAREKRLKLRAIRVEVEHTRVDLKAQIVREGKAIDGFANILKALIVPVEEHLEKQEKFAELAQEKRLAERLAMRQEQLRPYVVELSVYNLKEMSDSSFENLFSSSKTIWEHNKAQAEKEEAQRIELEKKREVFRKRQMQLAPHIPDFLDMDVTLDTSEKDFIDLLNLGKKNKAEYIAEQEKVRAEKLKLEQEKAENEKKLAKERAEQQKKIDEANRQKLEAENKLKEQARLEEQKKLEEQRLIDEQKRLEEEQKRKALLAPDKEKLLKFATEISSLQAPALQSRDADAILKRASEQLRTAISILQQGASKL